MLQLPFGCFWYDFLVVVVGCFINNNMKPIITPKGRLSSTKPNKDQNQGGSIRKKATFNKFLFITLDGCSWKQKNF